MNKVKDFFTKKNIVILLIVTMFFVFDRYLKYLAINLLEDFVIVKNILTFTFFANKYISFSIPLSGYLLNIFLLILIIFLFFYLFYIFKKNKHFEFFAYFSIFLGAISNFLDRIKYSYVIDYLDLKYFTIFNLADFLIFCGCFFVLFLNFKSKK